MKINILDFDTVILDLDYTVWKGSEEHFWAKSLVGPLTNDHNRIYDSNGDFIELDSSVRQFLSSLKANHKNIGFITRGGLENLSFKDQPPVICLNLFGILGYFKYENHVLHYTDLKSRVISPLGNTIFIDDNPIDLTDVSDHHKNITVFDRNSFKDWSELYASNSKR